MGPGHDDLRATGFFQYIYDIRLDAISAFVAFSGNLFVFGQQSFGSSEVDNPTCTVAALNDAAGDFGDAVSVFFKNDFLFSISHTLDDDLLGALRRNAAKVFDLERESHLVIQLGLGVVVYGIVQRNFTDRVVHIVHNHLEFKDLDFAEFFIEGYFDVHGLAILAGHSRTDGLLKSVDQQVAVNAPVFAYLVDGFFQLRHDLTSACAEMVRILSADSALTTKICVSVWLS